MPTNNRRLRALLGHLPPWERAWQIHRARQESRKPSADVYTTMRAHEARRVGAWRAYFEQVATFGGLLMQDIARDVERAEVWAAWHRQNMLGGERRVRSGQPPQGDDHLATVLVANAFADTVRTVGQRRGDLEATLVEIVERCHGFDPLHAETRALMDDIRASLDALVLAVQDVNADFTIPAPRTAGIDHFHTLLHSDRAPT